MSRGKFHRLQEEYWADLECNENPFHHISNHEQVQYAKITIFQISPKFPLKTES